MNAHKIELQHTVERKRKDGRYVLIVCCIRSIASKTIEDQLGILKDTQIIFRRGRVYSLYLQYYDVAAI